jgi:ubiquinone/menaquinone biosynthesis C-methylase UbiE
MASSGGENPKGNNVQNVANRIDAPFANIYDDQRRAEAYATLAFAGTYYLAYRDLPVIIAEHVNGPVALDFGCGAGRSTRFLRSLGFDTTGIDVASSMIELAKTTDPDGTYRLVNDGEFSEFPPSGFDLILSAFAFDNIPGAEKRCELLRGLGRLLKPQGRMILVGSTPDIYVHEWVSFTTQQFAENRVARSGSAVRIVMKDVDDQRPVVDIVWSHDDYLDLFRASGLELIALHKPLGRQDEPHAWLTETTIAPWVIYVVKAE